MTDELVKDLIANRIEGLAFSIQLVAENLSSNTYELKNDAERIRTNLRTSIPKFNDDLGLQRELKETVKDYTLIGFDDYLFRIEDAHKKKEDVKPILQEMKEAVRYVVRELYLN